MTAPHFVVHNDTDTVGVIVVEDVKTGMELNGWRMETDETVTMKALDDIPLGHKVALIDFKDAGKLVLGICNGFQILMNSGILLADEEAGPPATLTWNDSGKFEDRWVNLAASSADCVFLQDIESMYLPVAHAEGKFVTRDQSTLTALNGTGQLALRYAALNGSADGVPYPDNPNGSQLAVAGVCDATGRVLGLMPHPERHVDATHHPRWTREGLKEPGDGLKMFQNAVDYFSVA